MYRELWYGLIDYWVYNMVVWKHHSVWSCWRCGKCQMMSGRGSSLMRCQVGRRRRGNADVRRRMLMSATISDTQLFLQLSAHSDTPSSLPWIIF